VTAAIKKSINELHGAIQALEQKLEEKQSEAPKAQKKSADLFSFAPQTAQPVHPDTKALASRLDGAIAKVEKLLEEA